MSLPVNLLKGEFQFLTDLWVSGTQALFAFIARHFGSLSLWCRSLGSICLMWGMNPLFFREKLHICEFHPHCGCLVRGHLCLSYPPCCYPFIFAVEELFSFHIFFKGGCSICSYRFGVSVRWGEFSIFLQHHSSMPSWFISPSDFKLIFLRSINEFL